MTADELGVTDADRKTRLRNFELPPPKQPCRIIEGSPAEQANELIRVCGGRPSHLTGELKMKILIIAEHKNGALAEATRELFGLSLGQAEIHAVVAGEAVAPLAELLGQLGATKVHLVEFLAGGTGESLGQALGQVSCKLPPMWCLPRTRCRAVILPRAWPPRSTPLWPNCIQLSVEGDTVAARRPVYAGKATAEVEFKDDAEGDHRPPALSQGLGAGHLPEC